MPLLRIYITVIVLLIVVYFIFYSHWKKITKTLTSQIDVLIYTFDKAVYHYKDQVFDYDTTKTLLFHNQQEFFSKGKSYTALLPIMLQDIDYISNLLGIVAVQPEQLQGIKDTYSTWEKIHTLKEYTHTIITILTLGIANLFLP